jgi:hypothetical protein
VFVDDAGQTGVGTTSPTSALTVDGQIQTASSSQTLFLPGGTGITQFVTSISGSGNDFSVPTTSAVDSFVDGAYSGGDGTTIDGSNNIDITAPSCDSGSDVLRWDGSSWTCGTDRYDQDQYLPSDTAPSDVNLGGNNVDNTGKVNTNNIQLNSGTTLNEFSTDENLTDDSDNAAPTEQAVKAYVDNKAGSGGGGSVNTSTSFNGSQGRVALWDSNESLTYSDQLQYQDSPNPRLRVYKNASDTSLNLQAGSTRSLIKGDKGIRVTTGGASGYIDIDNSGIGANTETVNPAALSVGGDARLEEGGDLEISAPGSTSTETYTAYGGCDCEYICTPAPSAPDERNTIEDCSWACSATDGSCDTGSVQSTVTQTCADGTAYEDKVCEYDVTSSAGRAEISASKDSDDNMNLTLKRNSPSTKKFTVVAERFKATNSKDIIKNPSATESSCGDGVTVTCPQEYVRVSCAQGGTTGDKSCSNTGSGCASRGGGTGPVDAEAICLHKYS